MIINKYHRWYNELMSKARSRDLLTGYVEKHHVIPKCMGGSNSKSNLIALTYREHFIAHWLLTKFTDGQERNKMLYAIHRMVSVTGGRIVAAWQYRIAREASLGFKHTTEARARISAAQVGRKHCLGLRATDEARARMSAAAMGRKFTDDARAKMSAAKVGRPKSSETRAKMSAAKTAYYARRRAEKALAA